MSDRHINHEHKWAVDEEMRFKATVRRNKLLGLWAAAELGLAAAEAEAYAKSVVSSDFQEPGEEDVFRKVSADFAAQGLAISETTIRQKMHEFTVAVRKALEAEG